MSVSTLLEAAGPRELFQPVWVCEVYGALAYLRDSPIDMLASRGSWRGPALAIAFPNTALELCSAHSNSLHVSDARRAFPLRLSPSSLSFLSASTFHVRLGGCALLRRERSRRLCVLCSEILSDADADANAVSLFPLSFPLPSNLYTLPRFEPSRASIHATNFSILYSYSYTSVLRIATQDRSPRQSSSSIPHRHLCSLVHSVHISVICVKEILTYTRNRAIHASFAL